MAGRPPKFESPEQLRELAHEYFLECQKKVELPTKAGLALHCETNKATLHNYEQKDEFFDAIKEIYDYIEDRWVQASANKEYNASGSIFYLKNAFHYKDRHELSGDPEAPLTVNVVSYASDHDSV